MGHVDEELLKVGNEIAKEQEKLMSEETIQKELEESILDGSVHIYGQLVSFSRRMIPELNVAVIMPELFFLLEPEMKKIIYPMGNPPSHVYGSGEVNFNLALSCSPTKIPNEGIPKFLPMAVKIMEGMGPQSKMINRGTIEKDGWNFAIVEFVTRAIDMNVYNVMFYFSIRDQLMIGTVNFPAKYQQRFVKIAKEMIDSIELIDCEQDGAAGSPPQVRRIEV